MREYLRHVIRKKTIALKNKRFKKYYNNDIRSFYGATKLPKPTQLDFHVNFYAENLLFVLCEVFEIDIVEANIDSFEKLSKVIGGLDADRVIASHTNNQFVKIALPGAINHIITHISDGLGNNMRAFMDEYINPDTVHPIEYVDLTENALHLRYGLDAYTGVGLYGPMIINSIDRFYSSMHRIKLTVDMLKNGLPEDNDDSGFVH